MPNNSITPYVCWAVGNKPVNKNNTFWGNYFNFMEKAVVDCLNRTGSNYKIVKIQGNSFNKSTLKLIEKQHKESGRWLKSE